MSHFEYKRTDYEEHEVLHIIKTVTTIKVDVPIIGKLLSPITGLFTHDNTETYYTHDKIPRPIYDITQATMKDTKSRAKVYNVAAIGPQSGVPTLRSLKPFPKGVELRSATYYIGDEVLCPEIEIISGNDLSSFLPHPKVLEYFDPRSLERGRFYCTRYEIPAKLIEFKKHVPPHQVKKEILSLKTKASQKMKELIAMHKQIILLTNNGISSASLIYNASKLTTDIIRLKSEISVIEERSIHKF